MSGTGTRTADGLVANEGTLNAAEQKKRKTLRALLTLYAECRVTSEPLSLLASRDVSDDEQMLITYALSMPQAEAGAVYALLDKLETRAGTLHPEPVGIAATDFLALHTAFNKAPAQLHLPLLGLLDKQRAATALALCLAPASIAETVWPTLAPILLVPSEDRAAAAATALLHDATRAAPLLAAYQQLSLSALAAVTSELPPSSMALAIIAQSKAFDDAAKLGPTWASLETLQQCKAPPVGELTALHTVLGAMGAAQVSRVARALGDVSALIDAAPHLPVDRWTGLFATMKTVNGRLVVSNARVRASLVRHEAGRVGRVYYNNPEQRSMIGFLCGWLLLLVAFFGVLEEIVARDLL